MKSKSTYILIAAFLLACVSVQAQPSNYTVTFLVNSLGQGSYATSLTNEGQLAGSYNSPTSKKSTAFILYPNGTIIDLGTLGSHFVDTAATSINLQGQVTGIGDLNIKSTHAFLYSNGTMTDLGSLTGEKGTSRAYGINNIGQVVGFSTTKESPYSAAIFWQGEITALGALNGVSGYSVAYSINNNHTGSPNIVGASTYSSDINMKHAFLYSNGEMTDIGGKMCPGTNNSIATNINDANQVVGYCCEGGGCSFGGLSFLYNDVSGDYDFIKIRGNSSGITAYDINNKGQVVGIYRPSGGNYSSPPFLYMDGEGYWLFDLVDPDLGLTDAAYVFINDEGQIVADSNKGVVLLTPVDTK